MNRVILYLPHALVMKPYMEPLALQTLVWRTTSGPSLYTAVVYNPSGTLERQQARVKGRGGRVRSQLESGPTQWHAESGGWDKPSVLSDRRLFITSSWPCWVLGGWALKCIQSDFTLAGFLRNHYRPQDSRDECLHPGMNPGTIRDASEKDKVTNVQGYSEFRPLLSQSVGYGVVIGVGFFFAFVMLILTMLQRKFFKFTPASSEEFTVRPTFIIALPGAIAVLLVVFMAVTSAASSELIGVSSLLPKATGEEIVKASHYFICFWAVWMGCWASILNAGNINLGWLYYVQGVILSPAVIPIALTISWSKLTRAGVFCGAIGGAVLGMIAWMIGCLKIYGQINIPNLADPYSAVCSGLTGLLFSGILMISVSLMSPADYDFSETRAISTLDDHVESEKNSNTGEASPDLEKQPENGANDSDASKDEEEQIASLQRVFKKAFVYSTVFTAIVIVIVPLPMFFSHYVFSREFYTFWFACSIIWVFASGTFCIILPLWESRKEMAKILKAAYLSSTRASST
ncbi:hypothetical protein EV363DRAFT_1296881 [Boletus edulis]|nr:hypothetical protein EV363DRAFT_1296881 [Boletus edulis]